MSPFVPSPDFRPGPIGNTGRIAAGMFRSGNYIGMNFGKKINQVSATPTRAIENAEAFRKLVKEEFGDLEYDSEDFPLQVTCNRETGRVHTAFPISVDILGGNPELFLAWADKLEEAAAQITASD